MVAAVVGVIAHLSLWFAFHMLFAAQFTIGPFQTLLPDLASVQRLPLAIAVISGYLLLVRHWSLPVVLAISAITSAVFAII